MQSAWLRICRKCNGRIDSNGSCRQCSVEGHQPGHSKCNGKQDEINFWQIYAEPQAFLKCSCSADNKNEEWEEKVEWIQGEGERVLSYRQIVGKSGVYLVVTDKVTGEVLRDNRPWQMTS